MYRSTPPYRDGVVWAVNNGITKGYSPTIFGLSNHCSHTQITTFLYRAAGSPNFSGNEKESVYNWMLENEIATTLDDEPCTRSRAIQLMWNAAGKPEPTQITSFTDIAKNSPTEKMVSWAVENGIANGMGDGSFGLSNYCSRGQIITFLYRASK